MIINNSKQLLLKIKAIMAENEISNKYIANKLNITESAFCSRLKQKNISLNLLIDICNALNYDVDINLLKKDDTK